MHSIAQQKHRIKRNEKYLLKIKIKSNDFISSIQQASLVTHLLALLHKL